jgi:hypothetical protein
MRKFWTAQAPVTTSVALGQAEWHALAYVSAAQAAQVAVLWVIEASLSVYTSRFLSYDMENNLIEFIIYHMIVS